MTIERMIELLDIEHECMLRNSHDACDSHCGVCDLAQDDGELHEMYIDVIALLKTQKPHVMTLEEIRDAFARCITKALIYLETMIQKTHTIEMSPGYRIYR